MTHLDSIKHRHWCRAFASRSAFARANDHGDALSACPGADAAREGTVRRPGFLPSADESQLRNLTLGIRTRRFDPQHGHWSRRARSRFSSASGRTSWSASRRAAGGFADAGWIRGWAVEATVRERQIMSRGMSDHVLGDGQRAGGDASAGGTYPDFAVGSARGPALAPRNARPCSAHEVPTAHRIDQDIQRSDHLRAVDIRRRWPLIRVRAREECQNTRPWLRENQGTKVTSRARALGR